MTKTELLHLKSRADQARFILDLDEQMHAPADVLAIDYLFAQRAEKEYYKAQEEAR